MADQPNSRPIQRLLCRCELCTAWWSVSEEQLYTNGASSLRCPCGGLLREVDMQAHYKTLPVAKLVPDKKKP